MMKETRKAPKDPVKKRSCIYIMLDQLVQGQLMPSGDYACEIYLDWNRLRNKAQIIGGVTDEKILAMLEDSHDFHKLVHSIGITVSDCEGEKSINAKWINYGKTERASGTVWDMECPVDDMEQILSLYDKEITEEDGVVGQLLFQFPKECVATVTVKLYLNDDYHVTEIDVDAPVNWESIEYQKMLDKAVIQVGNTYRFEKVIEKAQNGDDVTIAFIGGSITQGAGAVPINTQCYAYQFFQKFQHEFFKDKEKCHFIKAGIGGTSSELGLVRCEQDIEEFGKTKPDLIVVEFAVNDLGDETEGICHESLIYRYLKKDWKPAVIMLFSVFADDWNLQDRLFPIGKKYDLPVVSISEACVEQFHKTKEHGNVITKRQYFYDIFHPSNDGHRIMADCLWSYIQKARSEKAIKDIDLDVEQAIGRQFADVRFADREIVKEDWWKENISINEGSFLQNDLDLQAVERNESPMLTPQFVNNWEHIEGENIPFEITYQGKALFVIVKDSDKAIFGKADIFVDGKKVRTYDPLDVGWTHCNAILIQEDFESTKHIVQIKMTSEDVDKKFTILGLGFVK